MSSAARTLLIAAALCAPAWLVAQRGAARFPGGANPDGSLRPSAPVTRLFTQDAYTEYAILEPGSESFRIRFLPEETRAGATEVVNATRGGSEGSGIEVYDPRTGKPLKFVKDPAYRVVSSDLVFERTLHGLRNTVLLPAGWEVSGVSQSGTIGTYRGRVFVALVNLNAENNYAVTIRARRGGRIGA